MRCEETPLRYLSDSKRAHRNTFKTWLLEHLKEVLHYR
ncbi:MAG: hypothetical protein ACJAT5_000310 [Lentimonas sp.]|jgi:hypothetical protein